MKKLILITTVSLFSLATFAQDGLKGAWFATSQFGYNQEKTGNNKTTGMTILPIVGTFISPSVAVGAGVGTIGYKVENGSTTAADYSLFVAQPLVRKYYNVAGSLYFFGQAAVPIISGKDKVSDTKLSQYGLSVSSGFDFFVTKNFSVEFSYNLANLSQTTTTPKVGDKTTQTDFALAHVANANLLEGGTLTTPLSFGFKFIF